MELQKENSTALLASSRIPQNVQQSVFSVMALANQKSVPLVLGFNNKTFNFSSPVLGSLLEVTPGLLPSEEFDANKHEPQLRICRDEIAKLAQFIP